MPTPFYSRAIATTARMLNKYGMPVEFRHTDKTGAVSSWTGRCLNVRQVNKIIGDTNVMLGDDELLVGATQVPAHGDRVVYADENRVVSQPVDKFDPAGDLVYFTVFARKG